MIHCQLQRGQMPPVANVSQTLPQPPISGVQIQRSSGFGFQRQRGQ
jgi:hypothetical protein